MSVPSTHEIVESSPEIEMSANGIVVTRTNTKLSHLLGPSPQAEVRSQQTSAKSERNTKGPDHVRTPQNLFHQDDQDQDGSSLTSIQTSAREDGTTSTTTSARPNSPKQFDFPTAAQTLHKPVYRRSLKIAMRDMKGKSKESEWTVDKMIGELRKFAEDIPRDHGRHVQLRLEDACQKAQETWHRSSFDAFADMMPIDVPIKHGEITPADAMSVKFKQPSGDSFKSKGPKKTAWIVPACIKTDKKSVPAYKFHHVEIAKNILTPNTMLNFIPHLRDMESNSLDETKYLKWIEELDNLEKQSGFDSDRHSKLLRRARTEQAAILSMYLQSWVSRLGIERLDEQALMRYTASCMADQYKSDDTMTVQQKRLLENFIENTDLSQDTQATKFCKMFTEAFDRVFDNYHSTSRCAGLRNLFLQFLAQEESPEVSPDKRAKESPSSQKDLMSRVDTALASYSDLGCRICSAFDCEHGEYDVENKRCAFSVSHITVPMLLKRKYQGQLEARARGELDIEPAQVKCCKNQCFTSYDTGNPAHPVKPWNQGEVEVLESIFASLGYSEVKAQCSVSALLGRYCWEVHRKMKDLKLELPEVEVPKRVTVKAVPWYDRKKKQLMGEWGEYTVSHDPAKVKDIEPCCHDGPCDARCPCVINKQLCERFCFCTEETCATKFTGCACHSTGKTCLQRHREGKRCICIELNRECDPILCNRCGASERADPENALDKVLHSTGCQNVSLQRGVEKKLILGESQLEGCGYGLFAAEDMAQDEFVIEYKGEIITHDEGVRREARRGDVLNEASNSSYLFTLLEDEGIWVDALVYGNMSRYINHASESDRKGCNVVPKILYVTGEYRIKFTALRDIKTGEELFFNYGEHFPNLTKKVLDREEEKGGESSGVQQIKRKRGRPKGSKNRDRTAQVPDPLMGGQDRGKATKKAPAPSGSGDEMDWGIIDLPPDPNDDEAEEWAEDLTPKPKMRGGARPGAGRKPKQRPPPPPVDEYDLPDSEPEVIEDKAIEKSTGGDARRASTRSNLMSLFKTGGARLSVGQKPKVPDSTPVKPQAPSEDEEEQPSAPMRKNSGRRASAKKTLESEDAETTQAKHTAGRFEVVDPSDQDESEGGEEGDDEEGEDEEEDEDVIDRTRRKRQRPARYRDDVYEF